MNEIGEIMFKWICMLCLACMAPLAAETKILAFSGSIREDSLNKKLVLSAANIARQMGATVKIINLNEFEMPFYNADLESQRGQPENAKRLRQLMMQSDAIIIASPEYNGSLSGVLKNAIDWASRDEAGKPSRDAFKGKKFAIMSTSPGPGGGARGLEHLRSIIQDVGGEVVKQQVTVPDGFKAFDEQGNLKDPALREQLKQEIQQITR